MTDTYYYDKGATIILSSSGGSAEAAFGMHDMIHLASESGVEVNLLTTGLCQSAATYLMTAVPLERRYATRLTRFMMHAATIWNTTETVRLEPERPASLLKVSASKGLELSGLNLAEGYDIQGAMIGLYLSSTNLDREQLLNLLTNDSFFGAEEAREYGLIGGVL
jgi:ATP-dependent protease ClpP protease subunit